MKELIISRARELFFSYGLKSVSMDDISEQEASSKKTVYKFFDNRTQLVECRQNRTFIKVNEAANRVLPACDCNPGRENLKNKYLNEYDERQFSN